MRLAKWFNVFFECGKRGVLPIISAIVILVPASSPFGEADHLPNWQCQPASLMVLLLFSLANSIIVFTGRKSGSPAAGSMGNRVFVNRKWPFYLHPRFRERLAMVDTFLNKNEKSTGNIYQK